MTTAEVQPLTLDERSAVLARIVATSTKNGWRVLSQTQTQVQLVKGKKTSHGLHIFLSIISLGLWIPVWICLSVFAGEKQQFLTVDEAGKIHYT